MDRAKGSLIDALAALPWPAGVIFGAGGFAFVRFGLPAFLQGNRFASIFEPIATFMSWFVLGAGLLGATMSWMGQRQRRRLLDTQQGLDSIAALGWRHFEQLVGEAFRRQSYTVEETGLGGADGGIDLILRKEGRRVLVQCKQWRSRQIPVSVVREMYGLLAHHRADEVKIVCVGTYTRDAAQFASGKPIKLIDGEELLRMIRAVQTAPERDARVIEAVEPVAIASMVGAQTACPRCGKAMVERNNRKTGQRFSGCSAFPACRGVR
ncbi:restriction endonuclease [Dokdonella sp.]|uniref:restriction endonuclease n=1 Tax=Dokdonella sp. TaxID=2291710 RepID=UPI002607EFF2|nr:restriction endonuclease [Dokdonella sp.]